MGTSQADQSEDQNEAETSSVSGQKQFVDTTTGKKR
jgi:hypothetical protein